MSALLGVAGVLAQAADEATKSKGLGGFSLFLQRVFDGLDNGVIYAAIALSLVIIFKATTLINFAQGELATLGTFMAYVFAVEQGLPVFLGIAVAMVLSAGAGALIERTLIRPFDPRNHLPIVIITLGLFQIINAVAGKIWAYDPYRFPAPFPSKQGDLVQIGQAQLKYTTIGRAATIAAVLVVLFLLLNKTKIGLAFRAVSSNLESSELVGIKVGSTLMFGWALASAIGTLGGSLVASNVLLEPNMMFRLLIFALAAAALGGLDSPVGAVIGGLIVGWIQSLVVGYVSFIGSELSLATAFVVILVVLLFKPAGLFGTARVERV
ncbi:MAG: branched-chain amino acid ABC transporter permease [Acidimicrobiales bacterium]